MDFNNVIAYSVTLNLSHCTASNSATSVQPGGEYTNTLTADSGYEFVRSGPSLGDFNFGGGGDNNDEPSEGEGAGDSSRNVALTCTVAMGSENVTTAAFDISTGEIEIEEVTGDIVVTVVAQEHTD